VSVNVRKSDISISNFDLKHLTEKQFVLSGSLLIKEKSALHRPGLLAVGVGLMEIVISLFLKRE